MSEVRYLHVRAVVNVTKTVGVNHGAVTLAYQETDGGDPRCYLVGAAFCSPTDNFSRAIGRRIARARLEQWQVELANRETAPVRVPGTIAWVKDEPRTSAEVLLAVLRKLRGRPYRGDPPFDGPRWYPKFLDSVERGLVLRKGRAA